ncbi:HlyD family secretion protein [Flagellimonas pacifica]|uniref:HlyD family secretion protein n=1 Tax=Flagellimonas pacifica TaxID=1247520 RepID=A0A285MQT1_9FLAO|nr:HlyD family efflux transporter periplasmic adaptor subunit [Allomuricauda parva]SNY99525.1 HlyD family secretion protein [Allomuricauda parva]
MKGLRANHHKEHFGQVPNFWIRWGTLVIVGSGLLLAVIAHLISYPDIVSVNIQLMGNEPIVHLSAQVEGRIKKFHIDQGGTIEKDQVLMELENPAEIHDVVGLKMILDTIEGMGSISVLEESNGLKLGNIRPYFQAYRDLLVRKQLWDSLHPGRTYDRLSNDRTMELSKWIGDSEILLDELEMEIVLGDKELQRFSTLKEKGVVSASEYEEQLRAQINRKQERTRLRQRISETKLIISSQEDIRRKQGFELAMEGKLLTDRIENSRMELLRAIKEYERNYVIRSPIDGRVNWLVPKTPYQNVGQGEPLVAVIPSGSTRASGLMEVPAINKGKIKPGQAVLVQLENFPQEEYGVLKGRVSSINRAPHPIDRTYGVTVTFDTLTTSYGKVLSLEAAYLGKGNIITEEMNLWQRLFRGIHQGLVR